MLQKLQMYYIMQQMMKQITNLSDVKLFDAIKPRVRDKIGSFCIPKYVMIVKSASIQRSD